MSKQFWRQIRRFGPDTRAFFRLNIKEQLKGFSNSRKRNVNGNGLHFWTQKCRPFPLTFLFLLFEKPFNCSLIFNLKKALVSGSKRRIQVSEWLETRENCGKWLPQQEYRSKFFFVECSWKKMKNDTTFVCVRSGDHLGDANMSKKAPRFVEFNFLLIAIDRKGFRRMKEEGLIYQTLPQIFIFCLGT